MKVLITGSNGLLGQHLVKLLAKEPSFQVVATARGQNRLTEKQNYEYRSLDICSPEEVSSVIRECRPDAIIHAAAMTQVDDCERDHALCWDVNVKATEYLIQAARDIQAYFLLVSTDFIFDGLEGPYAENAVPNPVNYYGLSKLAAEMLLPASGLSWSIARTILVYGVAEDMSRSNIILWVKKSLEEGKRIKVVDDQWRTPTLVQDLADGCRLMVEKKATGTFHISGRDMLTPYEMALQVADFFNLDASLIEKADGSTFSQPARRPARTGFVLDKASGMLGYHPHSFAEGIAVVAGSLKQNA
jgi:dTDP-4-dehydrorhamnose reductase